jgi:hypothetical protein
MELALKVKEALEEAWRHYFGDTCITGLVEINQKCVGHTWSEVH